MKRWLAFGILALATLALASSCSKTSRIEIQSDTCWDGKVNDDQAVNACGNASYKIVGKLGCSSFQKQTVDGYLRVRVDGGPWAETTAPNGLVRVCK